MNPSLSFMCLTATKVNAVPRSKSNSSSTKLCKLNEESDLLTKIIEYFHEQQKLLHKEITAAVSVCVLLVHVLCVYSVCVCMCGFGCSYVDG